MLEAGFRDKDKDRGDDDDDDVVDRRAFTDHDGNPVAQAKTNVEKPLSTLPTINHPDLVSN